MKGKKIMFKWPRQIYVFWLVDFILGLELIGPALLIFFKDWGGLNQTKTQMLQSWFTLWIFILEIPTGIFGDVKGKKYSVMLGYIFMSIGTIVYTIVPNIWLFLLAEFLFAVGIAFISGAKEAWMYETSKKLNIEEKFTDIVVTNNNLHMLGMIVSSSIFVLVSKYLPVHHIFRVGVITRLIAVLLLTIFVEKTEEEEKHKEKKQESKYKKILKDSLNLFKRSHNLINIAIYVCILSATSYFVIWLYQEVLRVLNISTQFFGTFKLILLVAEIVAIRLAAMGIKKYGLRKMLPLMAIVVGVGFFVACASRNMVGVVFLLIFAGGLGLQIYPLLSKEINEEIDNEQRNTVFSFIGMLKRLLLTVFNPIMGRIVDVRGVFAVFGILGAISLLAGFFKPKYKSK